MFNFQFSAFASRRCRDRAEHAADDESEDELVSSPAYTSGDNTGSYVNSGAEVAFTFGPAPEEAPPSYTELMSDPSKYVDERDCESVVQTNGQ